MIHQVIRGLLIGGVGVVAILGIGHLDQRSHLKRDPISASVKDVNSDGLEDVVLMNRKDDTYNSVLIQRPEGTYERTTVRLDSGIPFYDNGKGYYTPDGNFLPR